jgi:hypothetical protein
LRQFIFSRSYLVGREHSKPLSGDFAMPANHSTRANKPNKPYPDFPLYAHAAGA